MSTKGQDGRPWLLILADNTRAGPSLGELKDSSVIHLSLLLRLRYLFLDTEFAPLCCILLQPISFPFNCL